MSPEEIREQISSLNDQLKATLQEVNSRHSERNLLLDQIREIELEKAEALGLTKEVHARLDDVKKLHIVQREEINALEEVRARKEKEIEGLIKTTGELKNGVTRLNETIRDLKKDRDRLRSIRKELEEAESKRPLIDAVKNELLSVIDDLNDAKAELDIVTRKTERLKENNNRERSQHLVWLSETKRKITQKNNDSDNLKKEQGKIMKDFKVVERRLRRFWPKDKPFPKIWLHQ